MGGPGSAKGGQGFKFDGKTLLILTIPFFAPSGFWKVPRGSRERVRRPGRPPRRSLKRGRGPKRCPRPAKKERSLFFWAPGGGPNWNKHRKSGLRAPQAKFETLGLAILQGTCDMFQRSIKKPKSLGFHRKSVIVQLCL